MGNFWTSQLPESMNQTISLFRFPLMNPDLAVYEEAPTNVLFIPKNVKNKKNAELFLKFMAQADVQQRLNQTLGMLAPQNNISQGNNHFLNQGEGILTQAEGLSQYYDRDSPQPIALKGMKEIKRFLLDPETLEDVLLKLESLRKESFALNQH